jgi:folate-dependent phosphoribosylglycinamide formyltransferase PurN
MGTLERPQIMVAASGSASTLAAIVRTMEVNRDGIGLDPGFDVGLVVSDHPEKTFPTVDRLNAEFGLDIRKEIVNRKLYPRGAAERGITDEESEMMCRLFEDGGFAATALLGYMQIVRGVFMEKYGWKEGKDPFDARIINTHPGVIPQTADTHGEGTSQKAIDLGLEYSAHTLHTVAPGVDLGPKIWETPVPIEPNDTADDLFQRVQIAEKAVLPVAINHYLIKLLERQTA